MALPKPCSLTLELTRLLESHTVFFAPLLDSHTVSHTLALARTFWGCYTRLDSSLSDFFAYRHSFEATNMTDLTNELTIRVTLLYVWRAEMPTVESKKFPRHGNKAMFRTEAETQYCTASNGQNAI